MGGGIGRWIVCVRYLFGEFHSTRCLPQRSFDGGFCEPEEVFPVPLFLELSGLELDGFLVALIYVTDGSDARSPLSAGFWCSSRAMGFFAQATPKVAELFEAPRLPGAEARTGCFLIFQEEVRFCDEESPYVFDDAVIDVRYVMTGGTGKLLVPRGKDG